MVVYFLAIHIFFGEIAALVLKNLAVHGQDLREKTYFSLFLKLIASITVDEDTFPSCVCMQIQKAKKFSFFMKVQNNLFDCIYWWMSFWIGIDVTSIEIDSIRVYSVMATSHSIRVEDGKQIEDEFIP